MLDTAMWWVLIQRVYDVWTVWCTGWNLNLCNKNHILSSISCLKRPATFPYLSLMNPIYTLLSFFFLRSTLMSSPLCLVFQSDLLPSSFLTKTCIPGMSVGRQGFRITLLLVIWRKARTGASVWQALRDLNPVFSEYTTRTLPIHVLYQSLLFVLKIVKIMHYDTDARSDLTFFTVTHWALLA